MSCEAVNEVVMANRSDWHLLEPANTPGTFEAVSLMWRRCADFHRGPGRNFTPYQRPDVWQQPDPFTPSTAWHWGAVHVWTVWHRPLVLTSLVAHPSGRGHVKPRVDGGSGAPDKRVAGVGHRSTGDADL